MMKEVPETDWILVRNGDYHEWGCKACLRTLSIKWDPPIWDYCPFCGAERVHKNEEQNKK